jgi:hypothetical protein
MKKLLTVSIFYALISGAFAGNLTVKSNIVISNKPACKFGCCGGQKSADSNIAQGIFDFSASISNTLASPFKSLPFYKGVSNIRPLY